MKILPLLTSSLTSLPNNKIVEKALNTTIQSTGYETITNATYVKYALKISVDTVEIQGIKTARIKKGFINDKLIKTVIHVFDKDGKFMEKYTLPAMQTIEK